MSTLNEALARELQRQGVTVVFGLIGEDVVRLAIELEAIGIRYYAARHEAGAVGMADGYSRVSGELGVALISRGPGVTNAITAIATAAKIGSRLRGAHRRLRPRDARHRVLEVDRPAGPLRRSRRRRREPRRCRERGRRSRGRSASGLAAASRSSRAFPGEILLEEAGDAPTRAALPADPSGGDPDPAAIAYLADLLMESWAFRRPLILAGRGRGRGRCEAGPAAARRALRRAARHDADGSLTVRRRRVRHGHLRDVLDRPGGRVASGGGHRARVRQLARHLHDGRRGDVPACEGDPLRPRPLRRRDRIGPRRAVRRM